MDKLKYEHHRDSTKRNYYCVWRCFNEFYVHLDVKPGSWEERLALFVTFLVDSNKKSTTIRSYISAIKSVLRDDDYELNEDKYLLSSLTKACKLKNDTFRTRLPIQKGLLMILLRKIDQLFDQQPYLLTLYRALFLRAYFGLF